MRSRKSAVLLAVPFLAALFLTGCGALDSLGGTLRRILVDRQTKIYEKQFDTVSEESLAASEDSLTEMDYAYSMLSEEDRENYAELLEILVSYGEDVHIRSMNPDQVDLAYQAILMDHPELFYIKGYTITKHAIDGETAFYTFTGQYVYNEEERDDLQQQIDEKVDAIFADIPQGASSYDQEKYVYDYIIRNTDYNEEASDNQNIVSVLLNGESVCQGYAAATQYLLKTLGIPCTTVTGDARNSEGNYVAHAWNFVQLDGEYYYVDTTWGDPVSGIAPEVLELMEDGYVNYDYLNLTFAQISEDHEANAPVEIPNSTATEYNYYQKEGLFYESYDRELLAERLQTALDVGETCLMMKFSDSQVYDEYIRHLFDGQEIFSLLPSQKSISYTADPENCLLILYLAS